MNARGLVIHSLYIMLCCISFVSEYTFCKLSVSYQIHVMHFLTTEVHGFIACVIMLVHNRIRLPNKTKKDMPKCTVVPTKSDSDVRE